MPVQLLTGAAAVITLRGEQRKRNVLFIFSARALGTTCAEPSREIIFKRGAERVVPGTPGRVQRSIDNNATVERSDDFVYFFYKPIGFENFKKLPPAGLSHAAPPQPSSSRYVRSASIVGRRRRRHRGTGRLFFFGFGGRGGFFLFPVRSRTGKKTLFILYGEPLKLPRFISLGRSRNTALNNNNNNIVIDRNARERANPFRNFGYAQ